MIHIKRFGSIPSVAGLFLLLSLFFTVHAGQPLVWETSSRAEFLKGDARGVSISDAGVLMLAPRLTEIFNTQQTYIWATAVDSQGNVFLGTGHDGRIYRVTPDGKGSLLYDAAELDVTALAVGHDGALFAGTSPDGKVYRITPDGHTEVYFDPADKYIWSLAVLQDGSLAVGTGDTGKLYRVRSAGATPASSLLVSTTQTHVISLAVTAQGDLIAGTDSGGLVLRISPDGKTFALFDTQLREIHALAPAADGSIYALALSDAAATARPPATPAAAPPPSETGTPSTSVTITPVDESGAPIQSSTTTSRSRTDLSNARSAVFRILPDGAADTVWSSTTVTAFSIAPGLQPGSVLIGTADKGRIYSVTNNGRDTLLLQSSEAQISSFLVRNNQVYAASSPQTWLEDVALAYLPRNVAPEILSITALPVGIGLQQVVQITVDPNVESSGLDPSLFGPIAQVPPRRFYQRGARSFQWLAEDRNGDTLEYAIYYRALNDQTFRLLKDKLRDNFYTIDGATLADGRYVIKIVASDGPDNPPVQKLTGERLSEPVDIDNTPPVVRVIGQPQLTREGVSLVFSADDATGKIKRSDASIDGSAWSPIFPDDGIADSGHETYSVAYASLAPGEHTISLRSFDTSGNVGTLSVTVRR